MSNCEIFLVQGTTTNGRYLLPFRTGAFLAGVPVQPVIIKYGQAETVQRPRNAVWQLDCIETGHCVRMLVPCRPCLPRQTQPCRPCLPRKTQHGRCRINILSIRGEPVDTRSAEQLCVPPMQNRISPSWETIDAKWHIFLMLCNPLHWVNIVEVRGAAMHACVLRSQSG